MRIQHLSPQVANQIAAGEVIERPASVVKELLENALDAGAKHIHVEIGFGGLNLIRVSDNGIGIVADDLVLAIAPHATSKIKQLDDLSHIDSMGFRGEALASIASISRFTLSSKPSHQDNAMRLQSDEQGCRQSPCARSQGTTIEVLDLFYNTPVRKKFLKGERIEFQAIETVVKRFALGAPQVALSLKHNGKEVFVLPAANDPHNERLRIQKVFGKSFMDEAIEIDTHYGHLHLRGWLSSPVYQRSQRDRQWTYLNRRMIQDKLLYHAIQQAYQTVLHPGRYATCLLYLTLPVDSVDVNVHPTKHEVRFQSPRMVHDFVVSVLTEKLDAYTQNSLVAASKTNAIDSLMPIEQEKSPAILNQIEPHRVGQDDVFYQRSVTHLSNKHTLNDTTIDYINLPVSSAHEIATESNHFIPALSSISSSQSRETVPSSWYIVNATFVLVTSILGDVYLVHALLAYQALCRARIMANTDHLLPRPLLVPLKISIHKTAYILLESLQTQCLEWGIHFDFLSESEILVRTVPSCLPQFDIKRFFTDIIANSSLIEISIDQVIVCQTFNVYHCDIEEKLELLGFIQQHAFKSEYCKRLDETTCLSVMTNA